MKLVPPPEDLQLHSADLKTLRLAAPLVNAESLARYLAFQRAYVEYGEAHPRSEAEAHRHATTVSGASMDEIGRIGSMCSDYAGRRSVEKKLLARQAAVRASMEKARASGSTAEDRDLELDQKIAEELLQGTAKERIARRYGEAAADVLEKREADILELHQRQLRIHM